MPHALPTPSRPIHVLMVSGSLPPMHCGVGDYTAKLAAALGQDAGVRVDVLTTVLPAGSQAPPREGFRALHVIDRWIHSRLRTAIRAAGARPDIVHFQYPAMGYGGTRLIAFLACHARWLWRVPVVITLHEPLDPRPGPHLALFLAAARRFVVVRQGFRHEISSLFARAIRGKSFDLIPNSSSIPRVTLSPELMHGVRERFAVDGRRLIAYFGFIQPKRGIEQLFDLIDPASHVLVMMGGRLRGHEGYFDELLAKTTDPRWRGAVHLTGYLPDVEVGQLLAAADAVVLPFLEGVGAWSTSLHAASLQGTFVLTTSRERSGYDAAANVFFARPSDVGQMRDALAQYASTRQPGSERFTPTWTDIALRHRSLYENMLGIGDTVRAQAGRNAEDAGPG